MKSTFYYKGHYLDVAGSIKNYINSSPEFLSQQTAGSTRAVGDALESLLAEKFDTFWEIGAPSIRMTLHDAQWQIAHLLTTRDSILLLM